MRDKNVAIKILDYWYTMEFLNQPSYKECTEQDRLIRELKEFKSSPKKYKDYLFVFEQLDKKSDVVEVIKTQSKKCGMSTWGNITFFIGKIKRQKCIENLAQVLDVSLDQVEKNDDDIAVLSFQCNSEGQIIENSLSLSPIVWALCQLKDGKKKYISELLSDEKYYQEVRDLEKYYFKRVNSTLSKMGASIESDYQEDCKNIDVYSITNQMLNKIIMDIKNRYDSEITDDVAIKYQLFKDLNIKNLYEEDSYTSLNNPFFASDLKMVKNYLDDSNNRNIEILSDIMSYISAPYNGMEQKKYHDLINPSNKEQFLMELSEILNIRNAPIAKWPSRYAPALMQQVAINFATTDNAKGIFAENRDIFSVNGPPGTGKTTLLKEIIASNIVEKAKLLSQYDQPDNAFKEVYFELGEYNGAYVPPQNGYRNSLYSKWYEFENKCIANYGILVTSSNNTAVENITRELPLEKDMSKYFKEIFEIKNSDFEKLSNVVEGSLQGVQQSVNVRTNDEHDESEYSEIYFTEYARKFFGSSDVNVDAWGLVAAPLGKQSNVNRFYKYVLNPLLFDMNSNADIQRNLEKYEVIRREFKNQLKKVEELRESLSKYADITLMIYKEKIKRNDLVERHTQAIDSSEKQLFDITNKLKQIEVDKNNCLVELKNVENKCNEIKQKISDYQQKIDDLSIQEIVYRKNVMEVENSVSYLTKLFRKTKYKSAMDLSQLYRNKANDCLQEILVVSKNRDTENHNQGIEEKNREKIIQNLKCILSKKEELSNEKDYTVKQLASLQSEIDNAKCYFEKLKSDKEILLKQYRESDNLTEHAVDKKFINQIFSEDIELSTKAQISNPWSTEKYNREREKLFFLALKMTQYFLLSSKACRTNLQILGQYWGLRKENNEKIKFAQEEKEDMIGSLLNTLFLVVPVISSTFASVGSLLRDVKRPGEIGTLIIDEAGQAQPQMAVGSIFRSRKTIVVGDPKQVEPVVMEDLKLLKEAYSESIYANYKKKTLSVQQCADIINPFGTFLDNDSGNKEWIGCPLVVHRRCISPMYDISNQLSYNNIMKTQTSLPSKDKGSKFIDSKSQWINILGKEKGNGNHFVYEQGEKVCQMLNIAFDKAEYPDVYIISPFSLIVKEIRNVVREYALRNRNTSIGKSKVLTKWLNSHVGTVHTFQGKEADEVIFVLGCDETIKNKYAVTNFVNSNIVNVAVTRAKYRLYIIGDITVWKNNPFIKKAKQIIDTLPIKNIVKISQSVDSPGKEKMLEDQARQLPGAQSFIIGDFDSMDYTIDSEDFISTLNKDEFFKKELSEKQYKQFGFESKKHFNTLPDDVKNHLYLGMKIYYTLKPMYILCPTMDASCCGILFCKGTELYLRKNFIPGLKMRFPDYKMKKKLLKDCQDKDFMLGTIRQILENKIDEICDYMNQLGEETINERNWWNDFNEKLKRFSTRRNECCHSSKFEWEQISILLTYIFHHQHVKKDADRELNIGGLLFESMHGQKLTSSPSRRLN